MAKGVWFRCRNQKEKAKPKVKARLKAKAKALVNVNEMERIYTDITKEIQKQSKGNTMGM